MAAGSLVSPGTVVPGGEVWAGAPAKFLRKLEESEAAFIAAAADDYFALAALHAEENGKVRCAAPWTRRCICGAVLCAATCGGGGARAGAGAVVR